MRREPSHTDRASISLLVVAMAVAVTVLAGAPPSHAGKEPRGKTYFTTTLGWDGPFGISAECLTFSATELCGLGDFCMSWGRTEAGRKESAFSFELDQGGIAFDGHGRVDARGKGSSIGGAGLLSAEGTEVNVGLAGQAVGRNQCSELVDDFNALFRLLAAAPGAMAGAGAAGVAPRGKTYFLIALGYGAKLDFGADCLTFKKKTICPSGGVCGSWASEKRSDGKADFAFQIADETGRVTDARGRVDDRGAASSLGGVGYVQNPLKAGNFAFAARAVSRNQCARLVTAIEGEWNNLTCVAGARFGRPGDSAYRLPYPVGQAHRLSQSYCDALGGHHARYAYDFAMPIGNEVVAARAGLVTRVEDGTADGDYTPGRANKVFIEHDDGSVAFYAHLRRGSIEVAVGDRVETGETLAMSGDSGDTGGLAHLHFEVYSGAELESADTVPVNFGNARGRLDRRGGLVPGVVYEALP